MRKRNINFLLLFFSVLFCSCEPKKKPKELILYSGPKWDCLKINDSTLICVPGYNADDKCNPKVINIKSYK